MLSWKVIELRLVHTITMVSLCDFRGNIISSNVAKPTGSKTSLLTCSHRAEGHTKAVLAVDATEDLLFTGSKGQSTSESVCVCVCLCVCVCTICHVFNFSMR